MTPDLSQAALGEIAAFLPVFTASGFRFAHNASPASQVGEGSWEMVGYAYDEQVHRLIRTLEAHGWVYSDESFQWTTWMRTDEAKRLRDDPAALAAAAPLQLARLMTIFVRQERFVEGARLSFWEAGVLTGILQRADGLVQQKEKL